MNRRQYLASVASLPLVERLVDGPNQLCPMCGREVIGHAYSDAVKQWEEEGDASAVVCFKDDLLWVHEPEVFEDG